MVIKVLAFCNNCGLCYGISSRISSDLLSEDYIKCSYCQRPVADWLSQKAGLKKIGLQKHDEWISQVRIGSKKMAEYMSMMESIFIKLDTSVGLVTTIVTDLHVMESYLKMIMYHDIDVLTMMERVVVKNIEVNNEISRMSGILTSFIRVLLALADNFLEIDDSLRDRGIHPSAEDVINNVILGTTRFNLGRATEYVAFFAEQNDKIQILRNNFSIF